MLVAACATVFDPFYQRQTSAAGLVKSTGVDLPEVGDYVAAHGGGVEVVNNSNSKGAHIRVALPLSGR